MRKSLYTIIFLISLATLTLEITLTRIFSVTMWYHYAFMAISVAMLGMSTGAVKVYVSDFNSLSKDEIYDKIAKYSSYFGFSALFSLLTLLSMPFVPRNSGVGIFSMAFVYMAAAVPFFFSGVIISLILATKFMKKVDTLYAADLAGAALGATVFYLLMSITDAVTVVIFVSMTAFISAYLMKKKSVYIVLAAFFFLLTIHNHTTKLFKIEWSKVEAGIKGTFINESDEWESWTPFSRITVGPYNNYGFGWGISASFFRDFENYRISQKNLVIDAAAATVITSSEKPVAQLHHLRYDVTNLAHYVVKDAKVAVIGVGGGRDILSALHFKQKEVWGIEINSRILEAITEEYKDFTFDYSKWNNVHLVKDEARSFIERSDIKFDIIQASLIDSWAATASGAFVLTENSLYTVEGWKVFFDHLSDRGAITMSRWYYRKRPGELLRLTNLAYEALKSYGIKEPEKHILLAATTYFGKELPENFGTGTIIVSKKPFSEKSINDFMVTCARMEFKPILVPGKKNDSLFELLVKEDKRDAFIDSYPLNLIAPTDDSPFFFNMLKPGVTSKYQNIDMEGPLATNLTAVTNLLTLLIIVIVLSLFLIIVPLVLKMEEKGTELLKIVRDPLTLYFSAIGLGFMLIEIALLQKFTVFLGHPTYSIIVVLFTILIFTGAGSYISKKLHDKIGTIWIFILLLAVISTIGGINMFILPQLNLSSIAVRIIYSFVSMALIGIVLGMPFPIGMASIPKEKQKYSPWLWGINGAMGVISSVLATLSSIFMGISTTFFIGVVSYVLAMAAAFFIKRAKTKSA